MRIRQRVNLGEAVYSLGCCHINMEFHNKMSENSDDTNKIAETCGTEDAAAIDTEIANVTASCMIGILSGTIINLLRSRDIPRDHDRVVRIFLQTLAKTEELAGTVTPDIVRLVEAHADAIENAGFGEKLRSCATEVENAVLSSYDTPAMKSVDES